MEKKKNLLGLPRPSLSIHTDMKLVFMISFVGGREGAMALLGALRDCPTLFPDLLTPDLLHVYSIRVS